MTIAIATPTGNIGSRVTQRLLDAGAKLVLLVRNPDKLDEKVRPSVEVRQGSLNDADFVIEATRGAEALFWLTPYNFTTDRLRQWQSHLGDCVVAAVQRNEIPYVVNISSNGAHLKDGMGPISGLYVVEQKLNQIAVNVVHLRPGFFMENYFWQLESLSTSGQVFMPIPGDRRLAMIATQDIADVAASLLRDRSWAGQIIRGLHGPADLSFDQAATILSQELNKPITHVQIASEQFRQAMLSQGASADVAMQYVEMWQAISHEDYIPAEPRAAETTTPTTFVQFTRDKLKPLLLAQVRV
ncbi:NmrA family NAD(P)-binding protein [Chroococcidiopsis sp. CCMEE 29]|jgi:uncharacterized protein YbjT (DUF2867 family)|uniref:NmrA family NAD(P)-binding protein n=1 Tax=Chroococcidiopsis sp. CCMEE 29 TaxID=155894 RepID=UPI002020FFCF|nr:NmrA family NAD(P)-binding protein [Chroococcidiopsis sp. CCMEE 29]